MLKYFKKKKAEKELQKQIQIEILETLCSICLYIDRDGIYKHNRYAEHMRSHFDRLKEFSMILRRGGGENENR